MGEFVLPMLDGKALEKLVGERAEKYFCAGLGDVRKSGVQAIMKSASADWSRVEWQVIRSRPDFEGVFAGSVSDADPLFCEFDCKVCSQASFDLSKYRDETGGERARQLEHMFDRARYGVVCFFLMHWNARHLVKRSEPAITYAFPVSRQLLFWKKFLSGEIRQITRHDCESIGVVCPWTLHGPRDRVYQPDFRSVVLDLWRRGNVRRECAGRGDGASAVAEVAEV